MSRIRIFGIRHHGPGSARRLADALIAWQPNLLLIELPADAQPLIDAFDPDELSPPVAMLLYDPKDFTQAAYFPFAEFSPEWQALRYAAEHGITCRAIDLPATVFFKNKFNSGSWSHHPFRHLAQQTDFADTEQWWDHFIEQQPSTGELFQSIDALMTVLRKDSPTSEENEIREEYMNLQIRKAKEENHQKIAVICGAFHTPALWQHEKTKTKKQRKLKSFPTEAVWIPWSYERLTRQYAYGAGVKHPAWYDILFRHGKDAPEYWIAHCTSLLRSKGLLLSSASSIEVMRLAGALQRLRGRSSPGLPELNEAFTAVVFEGRTDWIQQYFLNLFVGTRTGSIDRELFLLPLQKDFRNKIRSARLTQVLEEVTKKQKTLDLRTKAHLHHSRFFYQTRFLQIPLATVQDPSMGARGNFKEIWDVSWDPSSEWTLIQAGTYGTTIAGASYEKMKKEIDTAEETEELARLLEQAFLCGFEDLFSVLRDKFIRIYNLSDSVMALLESLRTLTFADQYGDIRYKQKPDLSGLIDRIGARAAYLLPASITGLTSEDDQRLREQLDHLHFLLMHPYYPSLRHHFANSWLRILTRNDDTDYYHGKALKYAIDQNLIGESYADQQFARHLSSAPPDKTMEWLEGLLSRQILWIAYDRNFLSRLNKWLEEMDDDNFQTNLPPLRKLFSRGRPEDRRLLFDILSRPPAEEGSEKKEGGDSFSNYAEDIFLHFFPDKI